MLSSLKLDLKFSKQYLLLILVIHLGSMICVALGDLKEGLQAGFFLIISLHFIWVWLRFLKNGADKKIISLLYEPNGQWQLECPQNFFIAVELQSVLIISQLIIILHFKSQNKRNYALVLFADSASADGLYRLRYLLNSM